MSNYSLIELQFSDIEMIDFLSNHGVVVRKEERRFADEHSIQRQHRKSGTKMPEPEYFEKEVFVLYVNIEILCDDEEFVYDKERLLPIFTRQLKTVINPIIFSK
jgi:hypothetical protein